MAISIVYQAAPKNIEVKARGSVKMEYLASIKYSEPIVMEQYRQERDSIREKAIDVSNKPSPNTDPDEKFFLINETFFLANEKSSCKTA